MKKIVNYIILYVTFCLLQFFCCKYLSIFKIYPNFILIFIVYLGLLKSSIDAQLMGFLLGLTWDVFSVGFFGVKALVFTIMGYFMGKASRRLDSDKIFTQFVVVLLASIVYWFGSSFMYHVFHKFGTLSALSGAVEVFVTALIAPVVFCVLDLYI